MESSISDLLSNYCDQLIGITSEDKSKKKKKKKNNSKSNLPENDVNEEIKSEICNLEENKNEKTLIADKNHNIGNHISKHKNGKKNKKSKVKNNIKKEIHAVSEKGITNDGFKIVTDIHSNDSDISNAFESDLEEFENDSLPKDIEKNQGKAKKITEDGFKVRYEDELPPDDSDISDAFTDDECGESFEDDESKAENSQRSRITEDGFKIRYDDQLPPDDSDISDAFSEDDEDFQDMDKEMPNSKSNIHSIDRSRKVNTLLQGMIDDFGIDENALKDNKTTNEKKNYVPQGSTRKTNASKLTLAAKQKSSSEVTIIDYTEKRGREKKEKSIVGKEMPLPLEDTELKKTEVSDERLFKKARFEVFKFGMGGFNKEKKQDARVALAVKLGAKPPKKKAINYKDLQVQKKNQKVQKQEDRESKRKMGLHVKKSATTKKRVRDTNRVGNFDTQVGRFDGGVVRLSKSDIHKIKRKK